MSSCPGERTTIELIKAAARWLAASDYAIDAEADIPLTTMPARPARAVRLTGGAGTDASVTPR